MWGGVVECLCLPLQEEVSEQDSDKITPYKSELEYLDDHFQVRRRRRRRRRRRKILVLFF